MPLLQTALDLGPLFRSLSTDLDRRKLAGIALVMEGVDLRIVPDGMQELVRSWVLREGCWRKPGLPSGTCRTRSALSHI